MPSKPKPTLADVKPPPLFGDPEPVPTGWSDSKIEEVIGCLWTVVWLLALAGGLPVWVVWAFGIKAASDHLMALLFALQGR